MADSLPTLTSISEALDSLGLAMCVFDDGDAPLLWNRTFLAFFPEHAEQLRLGGAKPLSLRRFYERRRGLILLAVADHDPRIQVDHQPAQLASGRARRRERLPRELGALRPHHLPRPARADATAPNPAVSSRSNSRQHVESDATAPNNAA